MNGTTPPWSREDDDRALMLLSYGYNRKAIGERLYPKRTKNAVIGRFTRLNVDAKEMEKARRREIEKKAVEEERGRLASAARLLIRSQWQSSCSRPDCTRPAQRGYLDGLCAEHRRDLMPDRTRADMVADKGPVGW